MNSLTVRNAKILWDYTSSFDCYKQSEAIVVCCSYDLRVLDYAYQLFKKGIAKKIILSGNRGNWTKHLWNETEAEVFYNHAKLKNYDLSIFELEKQATNIGENIAFSKQLIPNAHIITFVTKPNTVLRVKLSIPKNWCEVRGYVSCPKITFPDRVCNVVGLFGLISEMVGDIERIIKYPEHGYQIKHTLPSNVIAAWEYLIEQGFTHHML